MEIGNSILKCRKSHNLSQEDLGKEIGVSRQTISKWELNETTPDLKQATKLAKIFNVSLDELTNNKIKEPIEIKKSMKNGKIAFICYLILLLLIIEGVALAFYYFSYNLTIGRGSFSLVCTLEDNKYGFSITYDDTHDILMTEGSEYIFKNIYDKKKHQNAVVLLTEINNHFKEKGGYCE